MKYSEDDTPAHSRCEHSSFQLCMRFDEFINLVRRDIMCKIIYWFFMLDGYHI